MSAIGDRLRALRHYLDLERQARERATCELCAQVAPVRLLTVCGVDTRVCEECVERAVEHMRCTPRPAVLQ